MNKSELIAAIAAGAGLPKAVASKALDAALSAVTLALRDGGLVTLPGFGTFYVGEQTTPPEANAAPAAAPAQKNMRQPKFRAGKVLKAAIQ